jgi:hypothetical protein
MLLEKRLHSQFTGFLEEQQEIFDNLYPFRLPT